MHTDRQTSKRMSRTRGGDNVAERALRSALFKKGLRFRIHYRAVPGTTRTIDIAFPGKRLAVFVDGCFWHGCPRHGTWPKRNAAFWRDKILSNRKRDLDSNRRLRGDGWRVLRIWEHRTPAEGADFIERWYRQANEKNHRLRGGTATRCSWGKRQLRRRRPATN
jgi:DNA mismatch endonuclease, patch repair protein